MFPDGEELEADEIIFATGYKNGRELTRQIFGNEIADGIDSVWGLDEEGEIRGVWRQSGRNGGGDREEVEGFWVAAGSFWVSRYYSRLLALQIAMVEGKLMEV